MTDAFKYHAAGLDSPAASWADITPSDTADLAVTPRAICALTDGTVRVTSAGGVTADIYLIAGVPMPIRPMRVMATGTSATGIVGLW